VRIPDDFVLGAATSAFQIEGALDVDGRGPSIWDQFSGPRGETGSISCDHYHRYAEDVELMSRLGLDAYRFSIAWPRIFPSGQGQVNQKGLDFYSRLVDKLLERGIEPWGTLYHWDLPLALHEKGGWESRETSNHFADYAETVLSHLGDRVSNWFTINEPWSVTVLGYQTGQHAPGKEGGSETALRVIHHLLLAHGKALERMRALSPKARAGIVLNPWIPLPLTYRAKDLQAAAQAWDEHVSWWFSALYEARYPDPADHCDMSHVLPDDLRLISQKTDYLGLNMYFPGFVRSSEGQASSYQEYAALVNLPRSEMGWPSYAPGLSYLLSEVTRRYQPPEIYVTENGCAAPDILSDQGEIHDLFRQEYLRSHLLEALRARQEGVPLKGYFAWSLLDNFEWDRGYSKRFGLIYIDYQTQRRVLKSSAHWLAGVAATREIRASSPFVT
jgi:beta-glucosidase